MNLFAKLWRRLFPPTTMVAKALDTLDDGWAGANWQRAINATAAGTAPVRVDYRLPDRLPGVWPAKLPTRETGLVLAMDTGYEEPLAMDTGGSAPAAWGFGAGLANGPGLAFLGFPYLAELEQITEYRTPAEALANEMTRRWIRLTNEGKDEGKKKKITEIEKRGRELNVQEHFRVCAVKTEWFGRCALAINIKGQDNDVTRQLPLDKIEKGSLLGFQPIEPYWMTPYSWNATHPSRPDFYKPQSWFELGKKTHHTRYCNFIFREVPDLLKPAYDFSGISITQLMMPYVNRWLRTAKNVNDLINIFSIVTLHTDLQALLQNPEKFMQRLQAFTQTRDNRGLLAIQKDKEDLKTNNIPLSSLDKLQAQAQEHMATPARMTLIDFFGITPSGLSVTAEPEVKARNKYVSGMQTVGFKAHVKRVLDLIQMDLYGEVDEEIGFEFVSLEEPTGKDLADIRKANTERDKMLVEGSIVSADEVRDNLRNDPEGGYTNLEGDAPEPPSVPGFDPESGAPLPEFGAEPGEGKPPKAKGEADE